MNLQDLYIWMGGGWVVCWLIVVCWLWVVGEREGGWVLWMMPQLLKREVKSDLISCQVLDNECCNRQISCMSREVFGYWSG